MKDFFDILLVKNKKMWKECFCFLFKLFRIIYENRIEDL